MAYCASPVFNLRISLTACAREDKRPIGSAAGFTVCQFRLDDTDQYTGIKLVLT